MRIRDFVPRLMPRMSSTLGRLLDGIGVETCGVGDPACDLSPVWYLLPANVHDEFRAALDVNDVTWLCGRVLSQALIVWSYQKHTNPPMANYAHVIGEVLAAPR
jgi:hypothetical protein